MASRPQKLASRILLQVSGSKVHLVRNNNEDIGLSLMAGSLISGRVSDYHRSLFVQNNPDHPPHPEHRLHLQIPGMLVSLSGILMFGWFIHFRVHVASVIISTAIGKRFPPSSHY